MGASAAFPKEYALCIEAFGNNIDVLPNTLDLKVGDGCSMYVNGEIKHMKVLSVQLNEHKAKYLARQLVHPTEENYDSTLFDQLNRLTTKLDKSVQTVISCDLSSYVSTSSVGTEMDYELVSNGCGVQTDNVQPECCNFSNQTTEDTESHIEYVDGESQISDDLCTVDQNDSSTTTEELPEDVDNQETLPNEIEDYNILSSSIIRKISDDQLKALAECLNDIPNGHIYFYLYLNKQLLPDRIDAYSTDLLKIRQYIDDKQRLYFPLDLEREDENDYWGPLRSGVERYLNEPAERPNRLMRKQSRIRSFSVQRSSTDSEDIAPKKPRTANYDIITLD